MKDIISMIIGGLGIACLITLLMCMLETAGFLNFPDISGWFKKKMKNQTKQQPFLINGTVNTEYKCKCCGTKIIPVEDDRNVFLSYEKYDDTLIAYIRNDKRYKICANCLYMFDNNGLINVPFSKEKYKPYNKNNWGCFGRSFKDKNDLYKFMMKMDILTDSCINQKEIDALMLDNNFFDKKIDLIIKRDFKTPIDSENFIRRSEVDDLLELYLKDYKTCTCCGKEIFTQDVYEKGLQDILKDNSIDEITRYGRVYEYEKKKGDIEKPSYFIDKSTGKLRKYCKNCVYDFSNNYKSETISPLKPIIYYDSVDQLIKLI